MASNIQRIIDEFKRKHLAKYSLVIPDDWLSQCAEFLTVETPVFILNIFTQILKIIKLKKYLGKVNQ